MQAQVGDVGERRARKIVIYTRVSTVNASSEQIPASEQPRLALSGSPVEHIHDVASGSGESKAAGLSRLLEEVHAGKVASVVVSDLTRISRSTLVVFEFLELCERFGVDVVTLDRAN